MDLNVVERNRVQWSGVEINEGSGVECNGVEWSGMELIGME